jgi:hypothetical protein
VIRSLESKLISSQKELQKLRSKAEKFEVLKEDNMILEGKLRNLVAEQEEVGRLTRRIKELEVEREEW